MSSDNDFNDIFSDFGFLNHRFVKRMRTEIDTIFKDIKNQKLNGTWETREINEPDLKGYVFYGHFGTGKELEPFDPIRPIRRRPIPERPFELPRTTSEETREPLTDVFEEENAIKIYVELPGEEKEDIQLKVKGNSIEVRAKSFYKVIELPHTQMAEESVLSEYKNGVLKITVPKKKLRKEDIERQRQI